MRTPKMATTAVLSVCYGVSFSVMGVMAMVNALEMKPSPFSASTSASASSMPTDTSISTFTSTRRDFWISTTAAAPIAIAFGVASPAMAEAETAVTVQKQERKQEQEQAPAQTIVADSNNEVNNNDNIPLVTEVVTLNLSIARGPPKPLRIEVFGNGNSAEAQFFVGLASATVRAPCAPTKIEGDANIDEGETCKDYESLSVGYKGSQLWRLVPNKRIDFGRVDSMFANRVPPTFATASKTATTSIRPSTKGAVSMKRGGGAFEFTVTPEYNPALDSAKEDLVVVGRIAPDAASSDFLEYLNTKVVVRKDILSSGADVPPLGYAGFARACDFSSPDKTCAQFKPIGRIVVAESSCESLAPVPVPGDAVVAD